MTRHNISYTTTCMDEVFNNKGFQAAISAYLMTDSEPDVSHLDGVTGPLKDSVKTILSHQRKDGYFWYTLEANETIGSEFVFLMHYLNAVDPKILQGIKNRILDVQRDDGTFAIYHGGPACLSTTIECYLTLRLAGELKTAPHMVKAREFILNSGGIEKARVFTKIHLAMFGLVPWHACPEMPAWYIYIPSWFPFNIYEFSSWARATIVPLLVFMTLKETRKLPNNINLDELFVNPVEKRGYNIACPNSLLSIERFFIYIDKALKILDKLHLKFAYKHAIKKCLKWTWQHVEKTEDIYPALAYCALAFSAAGYSNDSIEVKKPLQALKMFQQAYTTKTLPAMPDEVRDDATTPPSKLRALGINPFVVKQDLYGEPNERIHQQCCISPVWDTPWTIMALLDAGMSPDNPRLLRSGKWLMRKQILNTRGDWAIKNPNALPGGWAFEFENDYFPDVDDTAEVLSVIHRLRLPETEKRECIRLGNQWLSSMQNCDGGFGAFDKNQIREVVNRIPFSDHRACLDPSTPDITARMVEYFATFEGLGLQNKMISRSVNYIVATQKEFGGWYGRWGINFLYGTWNALMGLSAIGFGSCEPVVKKAVSWLKQVQRPDGGFSESPESYLTGKLSHYPESTASQTAWALMGLIAGGEVESEAAKRAAKYLIDTKNAEGVWDEKYYTGTGFEGHFYIRYHGYRHFFPLLALARFFRAGGKI